MSAFKLLMAKKKLAQELERLNLLLSTGQSLNVGQSRQADILTLESFDGGYLFNGVEPRGKQAAEIQPDDLTSLKPYAENSGQTHGYSYVKGLVDEFGGNYLFANHAMGGMDIVQLSNPSVMFENGIKMLDAAKVQADLLGFELHVSYLQFTQGESGGTLEELDTLYNQYKVEVNRVTGQNELPMIMCQTGAAHAKGTARSRLQYTLDNNDVFMCCAKYHLSRLFPSVPEQTELLDPDWTHYANKGYVITGEYEAAQAILITKAPSLAEAPSLATIPLSYSIVGNTIEIQTNKTSLSLDSTELPQCPSNGFNYTSNFDGELVPTVTVTGGVIVIDIGRPPHRLDSLKYGDSLDDSATHPSGLAIPCGNIRETDAPLSEYFPDFRLYNWLAQFSKDLVDISGTSTEIWTFGDFIGLIGDDSFGQIGGTGAYLTAQFEIGQEYNISITHNGTGDFRLLFGDGSYAISGTGSEETYTTTHTIDTLATIRTQLRHLGGGGFVGDIYNVSITLVTQ